MKRILYIDACPRALSRTRELADALVEALEGECETIKPCELRLTGQTEESLIKREALIKEGKAADGYFSLANQFARADIIVIAAPYWDLLFPAALRAYLEEISVCGITFRYSESGIPLGLCRAESLYYVTTAGGFIGENNFGFDYIRALSQSLFGIRDVRCFTAQGLDIYGADTESIMEKAKESLDLS